MRVQRAAQRGQRAFAEQATSDAAFGESIAFVFLVVALIVIFGGVVAAGLAVVVLVYATVVR